MRSGLIFSIIFGLLLLFTMENTFASDGGEVEVDNAWVRYNPMQGRTSAAYLDIKNIGDADITLVAVSAQMPIHAMMHQTKLVGGISKMLHLSHIDIASGTTISFAPRGAHIMLMNMPNDLEVGTSLILSLKFSSGEAVETRFKICPLTSIDMC